MFPWLPVEITLFSKRFFASLFLFIVPVFALILAFPRGINGPLILLLYIVIVCEGGGLLMWTLSKIMADESAPIFHLDVAHREYFSDKNKAETIFEQLKSTRKRSGEYQRYCRTEISKVLRGIVGEDSEPSPELEFLLNPPSEKKSSDKFDYLSSLDHIITKLESE